MKQDTLSATAPYDASTAASAAVMTDDAVFTDPSCPGVLFEADDFDEAPAVDSEVLDEGEVLPVRRMIEIFFSNRLAVVALVVFLAIAIFGFIGPYFVDATYDQVFRGSEHLDPCAEFIFGTDRLGRDMLVRCMYGVRISLIVGFITAAALVVIGLAYGAASAWFGGKVDMVMMRIVEIIDSLPLQLVVLLMAVSLKAPIEAMFENMPSNFITQAGSGMVCILLTFSLFCWTSTARIVRASILQLKNENYTLAAQSMGANGVSVIWNHLLPNSMDMIIVQAVGDIRGAIFSEAFLSFIGMGVSVPMASLGTLVNNARADMMLYPYLMIEPVILIFLITWSLYVICDALQDALDPRMQQR